MAIDPRETTSSARRQPTADDAESESVDESSARSIARPATTADPVEWASFYAGQGWFVLPLHSVNESGACSCRRGADCERPGAHPIAEHVPYGAGSATADVGTIHQWWAKHPEANVGIALQASKLVVVSTSFPEELDRHWQRSLPETAIVALCNGDGPDQYYYERPFSCPTAPHRHSAGCEISSERYVVAPPGLDGDGVGYTWLKEPWELDGIPEAPDWVVEELESADPTASFTLTEEERANADALYQRVKSHLSARITDAVERGPNSYVNRDGHTASGYRADAAVVTALLGQGVTREEIRLIYRVFPIGTDGEYRHKGNGYLSMTINKMQQNLSAGGDALHDFDNAARNGASVQDPRSDKAPDALDASDAPQRIRSGISGNDGERRNTSQVEELLELAQDAELFHTGDGTAYAILPVDGHRETWPVRESGFSNWLRFRFHSRHNRATGSQALHDAIETISARAQFDGPEREVAVRVAEDNGAIYLDLADAEWRAVKVSEDGWHVVEDPTVRFRRSKRMRALPEPSRSGSLDLLRGYLNVDDDGWVLLLAWLIGTLNPSGTYPILNLVGEQGASKSTTARVLRALVDPAKPPLLPEPDSERNLMIQATNARILAFDNLSSIRRPLADSLCRLATGGGFATRELYSNNDEVIFDVVRPMIVTGIGELARQPDFADRSLVVALRRVPEHKRLTEQEFWRRFERDRAEIIGALLDAVVVALQRRGAVTLDPYPRMADFAHWVVAAEPALWPPGRFLEVYQSNRKDQNAFLLEANPVASAVLAFMDGRPSWQGKAQVLLNELEDTVPPTVSRSRHWPKAAHTLSSRLMEAATLLDEVGIRFDRGQANGGRYLLLEHKSKAASTASGASSSRSSLDFWGDASKDDDPCERRESDNGTTGVSLRKQTMSNFMTALEKAQN